jgi:hypothetical protein
LLLHKLCSILCSILLASSFLNLIHGTQTVITTL